MAFSTACSEHTPVQNLPIQEQEVPQGSRFITFHLTDSLELPRVDMVFDPIGNRSRVVWADSAGEWSKSLHSILQGQRFKVPLPGVRWSNPDYICVMTDRNGPMGKHVFLPMDGSEPIYIPNDIQYMDTLESFVLYIDNLDYDTTSGLEGHIQFALRYLDEDSASFHRLPLCPSQMEYPWYDTLIPSPGRLVIQSSCGETTVPLK